MRRILSFSHLDYDKSTDYTTFKRTSPRKHLQVWWSQASLRPFGIFVLGGAFAWMETLWTELCLEYLPGMMCVAAVWTYGRPAAKEWRATRASRSRRRTGPSLALMPTDALRHCAGFLSASDLLSGGEACVALCSVCVDDPVPWTALSRRLAALSQVASSPEEGHAHERRRFFSDAAAAAERLCAQMLDRDRGCWIAINGRALNVTKFVHQHPGGGELLSEYAGKDATAAYESYPHSFFARELLLRYVAFSPHVLVGRPGFPALALRRDEEDDASGCAAERAAGRATLKRHGVVEARLLPVDDDPWARPWPPFLPCS